MADDTDPPIRKSVSLPTSLWAAISEYRFTERIDSEAETVRRLLRAGLEPQASETDAQTRIALLESTLRALSDAVPPTGKLTPAVQVRRLREEMRRRIWVAQEALKDGK